MIIAFVPVDSLVPGNKWVLFQNVGQKLPDRLGRGRVVKSENVACQVCRAVRPYPVRRNQWATRAKCLD